MPASDVSGFNQFQDEILVIDANMNGVIDPEDPAIAVKLSGCAAGERIEFDHPRYAELRRAYSEGKGVHSRIQEP